MIAHEIETSQGRARRRILLLQGPAGPFFAELQAGLIADGHTVLRVLFDGGDRHFAGPGPHVAYRGTPDALGPWLAALLDREKIDTLALFGDERPIHAVARREAARRNIAALCLEEGYFRPGYVTAEWAGNNHNSPLVGGFAAADPAGNETVPVRAPVPPTLGPTIQMAFAYYLARSLASTRAERALFHRCRRPVREAARWTLAYVQKLRHRTGDRRLRARLMGDLYRRFDLAALQVSNDTSLTRGGAGWATDRLIAEAIASFAAAAPKDRHLVFKLHPLTLDHGAETRRIGDEARRRGVSDRVHCARSGPLGPYLEGARGFLTITSTAALSALQHDKVTLVLGRSIASSNGMSFAEMSDDADTGAPPTEVDPPDPDLSVPGRFWTSAARAAPSRAAAFLTWIRRRSQIPGDFYHDTGRAIAVRACRRKLGAADPATGAD